MAAILGGLVAQEAIKLITVQYASINAYCVVDLVETWTGVIGRARGAVREAVVLYLLTVL
jgi:hypothetical protein